MTITNCFTCNQSFDPYQHGAKKDPMRQKKYCSNNCRINRYRARRMESKGEKITRVELIERARKGDEQSQRTLRQLYGMTAIWSPEKKELVRFRGTIE